MGMDLEPVVETPELICGLVEASCRCVKPSHEDGVHECECGGSWERREDGTFVYHSDPGSATGWAWPELPDVFSLFGL